MGQPMEMVTNCGTGEQRLVPVDPETLRLNAEAGAQRAGAVQQRDAAVQALRTKAKAAPASDAALVAKLLGIDVDGP